MSFDVERAKLSRRPMVIARIELDNAIGEPFTEYHCDGQTPLGQAFMQTITKVDTSAVQMAIASGLGYRVTAKLKMQDFSHGANGTFFGKLIGANDYYLDRKLTIYTGFYDGVTFDWANFEASLFFIKKISGPDSSGVFTVEGKDPLTMLDGDQASVPYPTDGALTGVFAVGTLGVLDITDNTGFRVAGGVCRIGGELVRYSALVGGGAISVSERGAFGSEDVEHESGENVKDSYYFEDAKSVDVIRSLIETYTPIDDQAYIPDTEWNTERDDNLSGELVTGVITDSTPVKNIIESICAQTYTSMWWNPEEQKIKLKAIGPSSTPVMTLTDDGSILQGAQKPVRDSAQLITQVRVYFEAIDYSASSTDKSNLRQTYIDLSPTAESAAGVGKAIIKRIYANYLPDSGLASASKMASRYLLQYKKGLTSFKFKLDVKDSQLNVGDSVTLDSALFQDSDGVNVLTDFIVTEKDRDSGTIYSYKIIATGFLVGARYARVGPDGGADYALASTFERENYGYICGNDGLMSDGSAGYLIS